MSHEARIAGLIELAQRFINGEARSQQAVGDMEYIVDDEFPDDPEMQDFVTDLARFTPGGGPFLIDEDGVVRICKVIIRRVSELDSLR